MKRPPMWPKQAWALNRTRNRIKKYGGCCVFMEMGTGKTRIGIHLIEEAIENGALLIGVSGPLAALYVWVENWWEWAEKPVVFIDLHETGCAGIRTAQALANAGIPVICLINYEKSWQLGRKTKKTYNKRTNELVKRTVKIDSSLDDIYWDMFLADESTAIKTPGSKVSRFYRNKLADKCEVRLCLTGSAYIKRPLDVWAQVDFAINPKPDDDFVILPPTMEMMKARYAIPHPKIRGAIKGYHSMDDLVHRLNSVAIMLKQSDVLDLQEPVHTKRYVYLSPKTRKLYDKLIADQYLELEEIERAGETVTAAHVFTLLQKQTQLAAGFLVTDPVEDPDTGLWTKRETIYVGTEKVDQLEYELRERDGAPTIIVTQFNAEENAIVEMLRKEFSFDPKILNGKVKGARARHELSQSAAKDMAYIVKESVGCRGIDLRWANMTIWMSHLSHTENYDQMLKRNQRGGQTSIITYRHILAKDTNDEKIFAGLNSDISFAERLEDDWRRLFE